MKKLILSIDSPRLNDDRACGDRLVGWCLAEQPIQLLHIVGEAGEVRPVSFGLRRPDVEKARPAYRHAGASGFQIDLPEGYGRRHEKLTLQVWMRNSAGKFRRYEADISLRTNRIQRIEMRKLKGEAEGIPASAEIEAGLKTVLAGRPSLSLRVDIVNKCNLRCVMCHYSDDAIFKRPKREFTAEEFGSFFGRIAPNVREVILSCGDEPLVSKHFPEILSLLASDPTPRSIEFCTNAMLMNGRVRHLLIEKGVTDLMLSMDGSTKGTMERIRRGSNYERVVGNILALRDLKRASGSVYPRMTLDFVMMNSNIHEAPAFVELCHELGATGIDFRHVVPSPYWDDPGEKLGHFPAKYNYYRERILERAERFDLLLFVPPPFETNERWTPDGEIPEVDLSDFRAVEPDAPSGPPPEPKTFPEGFHPRNNEGTTKEIYASTFCPLPFSEIMLRGQDEVLPCAWHQAPLGKLSDGQTLDEIFFGEAFQQVRRNMFRPEGDPNCRDCPVKGHFLPTRPELKTVKSEAGA